MKPEKRQLLHDLLEEDHSTNSRETALLAGRRILRRKRYTRAATRGSALLAMVGLAFFSLPQKPAPEPVNTLSVSAPPRLDNSLSDEQLLDLFPSTPVGLATIGDKKVLIFPRASDQEQFIGRF